MSRRGNKLYCQYLANSDTISSLYVTKEDLKKHDFSRSPVKRQGPSVTMWPWHENARNPSIFRYQDETQTKALFD